jgi:hypothetical protein
MIYISKIELIGGFRIEQTRISSYNDEIIISYTGQTRLLKARYF